MALGTMSEPQVEQHPSAPPSEGIPSSLEAEKLAAIAFRLWRRGNLLDLAEDECGCCKGEAQECYTTCR